MEDSAMFRSLTRREALALAAIGAGSVGLGDLTGLFGGPRAAAAVVWFHPFTVLGRISSEFGETSPDYPLSSPHKGIDYDLPGFGSQAFCVAAGTVTHTGDYGDGYGTQVRMSHADGWTSRYAHMINGSVTVSVGQSVPASTAVGLVGSTGISTGAHLHVELALNGALQNPKPYIHDSAYLAGTLPPPTNERRSMTTRFAKIGSGSGGLNTIVALAGDVGYPCPGNWQEYVRNPADGSQLDRASNEFLVHGAAVWIPAAQWDALKKLYTEGGPTTGTPHQTVSLSADDRALLVDIADKLTP